MITCHELRGFLFLFRKWINARPSSVAKVCARCLWKRRHDTSLQEYGFDIKQVESPKKKFSIVALVDTLKVGRHRLRARTCNIRQYTISKPEGGGQEQRNYKQSSPIMNASLSIVPKPKRFNGGRQRSRDKSSHDTIHSSPQDVR
jgi:hypothetical protein